MDKNLSNYNFLNALSAEETETIEQFFAIKKYNKGETILKQGQPGTGLYLIQLGTVNVSADFPGAEKFLFGELKSGDFFGEVSLLDEGPCTATVTATSDTTCLYLDSNIFRSLRISFPVLTHKIVKGIAFFSLERLRSIFETFPNLIKDVKPEYRNAFAYKKYDNIKESKLLRHAKNFPQENLNNLKSFPAFVDFTESELKILQPFLQTVEVNQNAMLCRHTEQTNLLYFIIEGSVQTAYEFEGMQIKLDVIGPGNFLGVLPYFDKGTQGLSIIVREYANLLLIKYADLENLKNNHPNTYYKIFYNLAFSVVIMLRSVNKQLLRIKCEQEISLF